MDYKEVQEECHGLNEESQALKQLVRALMAHVVAVDVEAVQAFQLFGWYTSNKNDDDSSLSDNSSLAVSSSSLSDDSNSDTSDPDTSDNLDSAMSDNVL